MSERVAYIGWEESVSQVFYLWETDEVDWGLMKLEGVNVWAENKRESRKKKKKKKKGKGILQKGGYGKFGSFATTKPISAIKQKKTKNKGYRKILDDERYIYDIDTSNICAKKKRKKTIATGHPLNHEPQTPKKNTTNEKQGGVQHNPTPPTN